MLLTLQDQISRNQDEVLGHMEKFVQTPKYEIDLGCYDWSLCPARGCCDQHRADDAGALIRGLEDEVDTVHSRIRVANKHIHIIMNTASEWR